MRGQICIDTPRRLFDTRRQMADIPPTVAATSTLAMVRAADARGVEAADLLERAGLTRAVLEDPDSRIPAGVVMAIWNALRERTDDAALQLVAPASLPFGAYRVIDYLVAASATVGDGVERFARFFGLIADAVRLSIVADDEEHRLCLAMVDGGRVPPVYVDYVFAALVTRTRMRVPDLSILRVELARAEPPVGPVYGEVFRAPVHFGASGDRLCFANSEWTSPMPSADEALARLLEEHARMLAERSPGASSGFRAEVMKALAAKLPESGSAAAVARVLHVSVRTLQRKLVARGTSFRELSDMVKSQLAQGYLADPQVSSAEVALLLGFSDPSSFNRAFRRWTGKSPGRWRKGRS